jgi:hypothetical protein
MNQEEEEEEEEEEERKRMISRKEEDKEKDQEEKMQTPREDSGHASSLLRCARCGQDRQQGTAHVVRVGLFGLLHRGEERGTRKSRLTVSMYVALLPLSVLIVVMRGVGSG